VLSSPISEQGGPSPGATPVITSPPVIAVTAKTKDRTRSHHRVSKRSKKKKGGSPPTSPSTNRGSREASSVLEESEPNTNLHQPSFAYQDQIYPGGSGGFGPAAQPPSFAPYPSPPYQTMQPVSPIQPAQTFGPYQPGQIFNNPDGYQMAYSAQPPANYLMGYSSRIEDVARSPSGQPDNADPNYPNIRSQYIMARQDSVWRAPR
jgi:hypothetical protein